MPHTPSTEEIGLVFSWYDYAAVGLLFCTGLFLPRPVAEFNNYFWPSREWSHREWTLIDASASRTGV